MTLPLVCVGNITIDDAAFPDGTVRAACLGGDAVYAVLAARLFEPRARMLAPVGNDLPASFAQKLESAGLVVDDLPRRDVPTIRNTITYAPNGDRKWHLTTGEETFDVLSVYPSDLTPELAAAEVFFIAAMSLESQFQITAHLKSETSARIYLDLQEDYIPENREKVLEMVAASNVFLPSAEEVRRLLGTENWEEACRVFAGLGPQTVVIKLAELGSIIFDARSQSFARVPAFDGVSVVDSTGAGDAFGAAFAAVHSVAGDSVAAARAGSVAASYAISDFGSAGLISTSAADAARRLARWAA